MLHESSELYHLELLSPWLLCVVSKQGRTRVDKQEEHLFIGPGVELFYIRAQFWRPSARFWDLMYLTKMFQLLILITCKKSKVEDFRFWSYCRKTENSAVLTNTNHPLGSPEKILSVQCTILFPQSLVLNSCKTSSWWNKSFRSYLPISQWLQTHTDTDIIHGSISPGYLG